ncbi:MULTISPECIES: hypothetical protein [Paraburkholderia]|nr:MULTISPECIES: hypothetical protein [Paraburkholderia]GJH05509.1 hypothetical protein CBA19C8_33150 [Paraburkholderia terrae]GJH33047.1 hypothetical protein CBA19CS91_09840 [Paraburkholderia hospita]
MQKVERSVLEKATLAGGCCKSSATSTSTSTSSSTNTITVVVKR